MVFQVLSAPFPTRLIINTTDCKWNRAMISRTCSTHGDSAHIFIQTIRNSETACKTECRRLPALVLRRAAVSGAEKRGVPCETRVEQPSASEHYVSAAKISKYLTDVMQRHLASTFSKNLRGACDTRERDCLHAVFSRASPAVRQSAR